MLVRKPALRLCFLPFFKRNVLSFGGFFKVRMGERSVRIREVKGSNPSRSIKRRIVLNDTAFLFVLGSCFFNTAAHRDVIQASCYPITSKTNYTTIVFKKFCITTRTRQGRPKPFLEREGFGFFVFGGVPRRTTKASAAHGRAVSAQAQCAADAYFLGRTPSPKGRGHTAPRFWFSQNLTKRPL